MSCIELRVSRKSESVRVRGVKKEHAQLHWNRINPWVAVWHWFTWRFLGWPYEFGLEDLIQIIAPEDAYHDLSIVMLDETTGEEEQLLCDQRKRCLLLEWLVTVNQFDLKFDCFSFANALHNGKYPRPVDNTYVLHGPMTGDKPPRTSWNPVPGDIMLLYDSRTNMSKHFAICLTDHLFISKCGSGGPIYAMNDKSILANYKCDLLMLICQICHHCTCKKGAFVTEIQCRSTE